MRSSAWPTKCASPPSGAARGSAGPISAMSYIEKKRKRFQTRHRLVFHFVGKGLLGSARRATAARRHRACTPIGSRNFREVILTAKRAAGDGSVAAAPIASGSRGRGGWELRPRCRACPLSGAQGGRGSASRAGADRAGRTSNVRPQRALISRAARPSRRIGEQRLEAVESGAGLEAMPRAGLRPGQPFARPQIDERHHPAMIVEHRRAQVGRRNPSPRPG